MSPGFPGTKKPGFFPRVKPRFFPGGKGNSSAGFIHIYFNMADPVLLTLKVEE